MWGHRYRVTDRGREITAWDGSFWTGSGEFELDGRHFRVRSNAWRTKFTMVDDAGTVIASADRVGRKRWTVEAAGQIYHFRRKSLWRNEEELVLGDTRVGSIRKTSFWRGDVAVELPGLATTLQLFVLGAVISMWNARAAAAAS